MSELTEFLQNQNVGVTAADHKVHILHSTAEWIVAVAEGLHVVHPTFIGVAGGSTVGTATVAGVTLAYTGPILGLTGVFMALGAGYEEARQEIQNEAVASGFSQGFVAGLLNMSATTTSALFGKHGVGQTNPADPQASVLEAKARNRGLVAGYAFANTASGEQKKSFIFELRKLTGDVPHSKWDDTEKRNYVIEYAAKLRKHYLNSLT